MVFVLDQKKRPLMPCTPKRARLLLARGRAVVHRVQPFVIRLKDRRVEDCVLEPIALKIDPGSKTTGLAIVNETTGEVVFAAEIHHRGAAINKALSDRSRVRRSRRQRHTRYRKPRLDNRKRREGGSSSDRAYPPAGKGWQSSRFQSVSGL